MAADSDDWFAQARYQVRCEWATEGLARLAPADVVVVVDVLRFSTSAVLRVEEVGALALDDVQNGSINGLRTVRAATDTGAIVLVGALCNAAAVAEAIVDEQRRRGARTSVTVIAAGERSGPGRSEPGAPVRFAIEDLLGAGAIIDALGARGIDHTSPEAAAAATAFAGLRVALRHLVGASGSGREMAAKGRTADLAAAVDLDASAVVPVARGDRLVAWRSGGRAIADL